MLPRRLRLPRRAFEVVSRGRRIAGPHFSITVTPASHGAGGCAVVVSKAIARRAVDRHMLKRRVLDCMRPFVGRGYSVIVYARKGSTSLPAARIREELTMLASQVHP